MGSRLKKCGLVAAVALFAVALVSCAEPAAMDNTDAQKAQEIGDAFVSDLQRIIIPRMEEPEKLIEDGYVLSKDDKSYNMDVLAEFAVTYDEPGDSLVTMVFSSKSFVAARVVFVNGRGYYLRYEYDPFNPKNISVSAQAVDSVDLKYQEKPPKWEMKIINKNKDVASFSFYNPQESPE